MKLHNSFNFVLSSISIWLIGFNFCFAMQSETIPESSLTLDSFVGDLDSKQNKENLELFFSILCETSSQNEKEIIREQLNETPFEYLDFLADFFIDVEKKVEVSVQLQKQQRLKLHRSITNEIFREIQFLPKTLSAIRKRFPEDKKDFFVNNAIMYFQLPNAENIFSVLENRLIETAQYQHALHRALLEQTSTFVLDLKLCGSTLVPALNQLISAELATVPPVYVSSVTGLRKEEFNKFLFYLAVKELLLRENNWTLFAFGINQIPLFCDSVFYTDRVLEYSKIELDERKRMLDFFFDSISRIEKGTYFIHSPKSLAFLNHRLFLLYFEQSDEIAFSAVKDIIEEYRTSMEASKIDSSGFLLLNNRDEPDLLKLISEYRLCPSP